MKKVLIALVILISSCHFDASSTITITVLNESEDRMEDVNVQIKPYNGGDYDILIDEGKTDNSGEVRFLLEDWGNGTAWGTTITTLCLLNGDTLEIVDGEQIMVYQKGNEYDGEDYKETIVVK